MKSRQQVSASVIAVLGLSPWCAQADAESESAPVALEQIVVTARKREESAMEVPFALNVVSAANLEDERINTVERLFQDVPNLSYVSFSDGRTSVYQMRGVGPVAALAATDDTSVVTYIDGMPQPLFASDVQLIDLERVEVLKGPQGTLFGRNSTAGAVNFITQKPTDTAEFRLNVEGGRDSLRTASTSASGPLMDDVLAGRLSMSYSREDGYLPNTATGQALGSDERWGGRGSLRYQPGEKLKINFSVAGESSRAHPVSPLALERDPHFPRVSVLYYDVNRNVAAASLDIRYDMNWGTLVSLSGIHDITNHLRFDNTEGVAYAALFKLFGLPLTEADFLPDLDSSLWREHEKQYTQELRIESATHGALKWVAGVSYLYSDFYLNYVDRAVYAAPIPNGTRDQTITNDAVGVFGEATLSLTERLSWTLGMRGNHEHKHLRLDYVGNGFPGTVASFKQRGNLEENFMVGRTSLDYSWTHDFSSYATIGNGHKTGGFPRYATGATLGVPSPSYGPARSWSYELGSKALLWQERMRLNGAAFYNDVKGEHVFNFSFPNNYDVLNLDTRSYGAEMDTVVRLGPGFDVSAGSGYTVANFVNPPPGSPARKGNRVPGVPRFNGNVGLAYRTGVPWFGRTDGGARLALNVNFEYLGRREADAANSFILDEHRNLGARIGLEFDHFDVYAFGDNLLDEQMQLAGVAYAPGIDTVAVGRGTTLGVGVTAKF